MSRISLLLMVLAGTTAPSNERAQAGPQISIDYGTFLGTYRYPGVDSYLGIPFAHAPRFDNPVIYAPDRDKLSGVQDATKYGPACPQTETIASPGSRENAEIGSLLSTIEQLAFPAISNQAEDCLSINVQAPTGLNSTAGLPVMMWIFGGGYELGSSASLGLELTAVQGVIYQGAHIVQRSVEMGQSVVFVSANYRVNAFGGLASQEMVDAGATNLHLKDQRLAMRWVQRYIRQFGGDPEKVTLFGESAGSMSIATHLVLNNGDNEGLFRAAIMASGGIAKFKDYRATQNVFDDFAGFSGCGDAPDKLACLRKADYQVLYNAVQRFPNFFSYLSTVVPWYPRPDGSYLRDSPHRLLRSGNVANVPYIIGDMKDEGTIFSLVAQLNVTNDADFRSFFKQVFFPQLSNEQIRAFTDKYPQDAAAGSPFDTGEANQIGPQYKRMAAAIGDYTFQAGRRDLLAHTGTRQKAWTYLIDQSLYGLGQIAPLQSLAQLPVVGSFHVSDVVLNSFGLVPPDVSRNSRDIMSTYIAFVNRLDPNAHGLPDLPHWPQWLPEKRDMFLFQEKGPAIIKDDYREEAFDFINSHADTYLY